MKAKVIQGLSFLLLFLAIMSCGVNHQSPLKEKEFYLSQKIKASSRKRGFNMNSCLIKLKENILKKNINNLFLSDLPQIPPSEGTLNLIQDAFKFSKSYHQEELSFKNDFEPKNPSALNGQNLEFNFSNRDKEQIQIIFDFIRLDTKNIEISIHYYHFNYFIPDSIATAILNVDQECEVSILKEEFYSIHSNSNEFNINKSSFFAGKTPLTSNYPLDISSYPDIISCQFINRQLLSSKEKRKKTFFCYDLENKAIYHFKLESFDKGLAKYQVNIIKNENENKEEINAELSVQLTNKSHSIKWLMDNQLKKYSTSTNKELWIKQIISRIHQNEDISYPCLAFKKDDFLMKNENELKFKVKSSRKINFKNWKKYFESKQEIETQSAPYIYQFSISKNIPPLDYEINDNEEEDTESYLQETRTLNFSHDHIQKIVNDIEASIKENSLNPHNPLVKLKAILKYLHENYSFDKQINTHLNDFYKASDIALMTEFSCQQYSILFTALARAMKIPSRIVTGIYLEEEAKGAQGHMWVEVSLLKSSWTPVEPQWAQLSHLNSHYFPLSYEGDLIKGELPESISFEKI